MKVYIGWKDGGLDSNTEVYLNPEEIEYNGWSISILDFVSDSKVVASVYPTDFPRQYIEFDISDIESEYRDSISNNQTYYTGIIPNQDFKGIIQLWWDKFVPEIVKQIKSGASKNNIRCEITEKTGYVPYLTIVTDSVSKMNDVISRTVANNWFTIIDYTDNTESTFYTSPIDEPNV